MIWLLLLFVVANSEHIILKEGSIEKQTLGKDGLLLFHYDYPDYWHELVNNTQQNLTFFEINCEVYDVCSEWSDTFPHLVYSVDNSMWEPVETDNLQLFIFEQFEKRCAYNRPKCKQHELETLEMFEEESKEVIQGAIDDLRTKIADFEATFADYYRQLQEEFNAKRSEIRDQLERAEESIHVLEDLSMSDMVIL